MWLLPTVVVITITAALLRGTRWAALSLRISRFACAALVILGLLWFPKQAGFNLTPLRCEWTFGPALAVHSLTNYPHIVMFAIFFLVVYAQLPGVRHAMLWSAGACVAMGFLVEIAEGLTGVHHCRMRDLIPDSAGALAGSAIVAVAIKLWNVRAAAKA